MQALHQTELQNMHEQHREEIHAIRHEIQNKSIQRSEHRPTPKQKGAFHPTRQNEPKQISHAPSPNQQHATLGARMPTYGTQPHRKYHQIKDHLIYEC